MDQSQSFADGEQQLPLTGAQAGVWFAQAVEPDSPIFRAAEYLEIHGALDTALFERALRRMTAEADALHIRFADTEDGPCQVIGAEPPGPCGPSTSPARPTPATPPRSGWDATCAAAST